MAMWHNGKICESAQVDADGAGLLLGWGVFTTIRIRSGCPLWFDHHLRRLRRDAVKCDIEIPFSDTELGEGLQAVLQAQNLQNGLARLTATRNDDGRWHTASGSNCSILALESSQPKTRDLRVNFALAPSLGELAGVKTTSYLPYFWTWRKAVAGGFDETILYDTNERAIEAARSSLFWVVRGQLQTTPLALSALAGVGREVVLEWARHRDIAFKECPIRRTDLIWCDEIFLVSAATGPRSIGTLCPENREYKLRGESLIFNSLRSWWDTQ